MPPANFRTENKALNMALAKNKTGRTSASGVYFKYDTTAEDSNTSSPKDPFELCLNGQDWSDKRTSYTPTADLSAGSSLSTYGCVGYSPVTSITDVSVTKGASCDTKQTRIKSLTFPLAFEKMKSGSDVKAAYNSFGITSDTALCMSNDVLSNQRLTDIKFVKGSCPAPYTADPNTINGYTLCKAYGPKPTDAVLAVYQKELDDALAKAAFAEEEAFEENLATLPLMEQIQLSKKYQLYAAGAGLGTLCICICLCGIFLFMRNDD